MKLLTYLGLYFFLISTVFSQEKISDYTIDIEVMNSGDLIVEETITVKAEGDQIKRGIYRSFPTTYDDKMGTEFKVGFDVIEVLKDGSVEPYFTKKQNNGVIVYIGDKNRFLSPGNYTYTLKYRTTRQIGFFEDFDELYFNAIGGDWVFPIEKAEVKIKLPKNTSITDLVAFSGYSGNTTCACDLTYNENVAQIVTTKALRPYEQLTFAVTWPKGIVKEPTTAEKWLFFFNSNFHVIFALLSLIAVFFIYFFAWKKVGVDPPKGTIIPLYEPPAGFSPAEVAFLSRLRMTKHALTSAIVSLAIKGYLKIEYSKKKYSLQKVLSDESLLSREEKTVAANLFEKGDSLELKNKNHATFTKASLALTRNLKKRLSPEYFNFNYKNLSIGIIVSIVTIIILFIVSPSPAIPIFFIIAMVILAIIFTYLIKAPTVKGRGVIDEIEGFKMYVNVAEKNRLNHLHPPKLTTERFEELLPYAIAIGVENEWGKKFENALSTSNQSQSQYNPGWYSGSSSAMNFSAASFTNDIGKGFSQAISSASTAPGSSSGSSGGSSGGGGGGGGGGGW